MSFAVGWTLRQGLVLGGTGFVLVQPEPDFDNREVERGWDETAGTLAGLAGFVRFYPNPRHGAHLEALAGFARYRLRQLVHLDGPLSCPPIFPSCIDEHTRTLERTDSSNGYVLGFGAGFEFWLSRRFSAGFTARLTYAHTWADARHYTLWLPTLSIGLTWN